MVVSAVLEQVQNDSPEAGFVRNLEGRWHKCLEHVSREKIGQGFRDLLHTRYRSSTKSKVHIRRERRLRQRQGKDSDDGSVDTDNKHKVPNSCETLEPISLTESIAEGVDESFMYDCPFSFSSGLDIKEVDMPETKTRSSQQTIDCEEARAKNEESTVAPVTPGSTSDLEETGSRLHNTPRSTKEKTNCADLYEHPCQRYHPYHRTEYYPSCYVPLRQSHAYAYYPTPTSPPMYTPSPHPPAPYYHPHGHPSSWGTYYSSYWVPREYPPSPY